MMEGRDGHVVTNTQGAGHELTLRLPGAWQESGWYPTSYCLRHRDNRGEITVSLENAAYRDAN
jgi:hypothetical protein